MIFGQCSVQAERDKHPKHADRKTSINARNTWNLERQINKSC